MKTEERIKKQKELVERMGRYFDKEGMQPIAGRILGLLMVMDKEQFTFDEITEELGISKSSASNVLKNLEIRGSIEYVTFPGDRKRYFQIKKHDPLTVISEFENKMKIVKDHFNNIIELKADKGSKNALHLKNMVKTIEYFMKNIDKFKKGFSTK